jgi:hypothetical protein
LCEHYVILEKYGHSDCTDERAQPRRIAQGFIGYFFYCKTVAGTEEYGQNKCKEQGERQAVRRQACGGKKSEKDYTQISAEHIDLAVGEIDKFEYAVNHRIAECDKCIYAAESEAVNQLLQKHAAF